MTLGIMTDARTGRSTSTAGPRLLTISYGACAYGLFLVTFLWAVTFVENARLALGDTGLPTQLLDGHRATDTTTSTGPAIAVDLALLGLFAVQHSVMARRGFKRWSVRLVPAAIEHSTYVLLASACLAALMLGWQPVEATVWDLSAPWLRTLLIAISCLGWGLVLGSTFLIDHWDLFGIRQVVNAFRGNRSAPYRFVTPACYRLVRHPIYLGFLVAFWVAPTMTAGHFAFALSGTTYILIGIRLEERDLIAVFDDEYRRYRRRVPMLLPHWRRGSID